MTTFAEPSAAAATTTATTIATADLLARLRGVVGAHPGRAAVHAVDGSLDFAELDRRSAGLARALRGAGVRRGGRGGGHPAPDPDLPGALARPLRGRAPDG
ncbi:hypothetical protein ADK93_13730, partial [Streptomyces sp. XY58]